MEIKIKDEYIKLGQALKLSGLADSGVMAKVLISDGQVFVNGEECLQRGKKLYPGDSFTFQEHTVKVIV